jgi:hypothetical protein
VVICPSCRHVNDEDATACAQCGSSLEPGVAALLPVRRSETERPPLEIRTPKPPSKARPYVIIGGLLAVLLIAGGVYLFRPDPCRGTNFESANFGYCLSVPEGWEAGPARFGADVTLDQFAPPTNSATVIVEAVDLESGGALEEWSAAVRQRDEAAGLVPGDSSELELDGVGALAWDVTVEPENGQSFRMREVVAVRDDVGWRITLSDVADAFGTSSVAFTTMLESWQFR